MSKHRWIIIGIALALALAVLFFLVNVSIPGKRVEGCLEDCAKALLGEPHSLRVLSFNILHGRPDFERLEERLSLIASVIKSQQIDIALLQEVPFWRDQGHQLQSAAAYLAAQTGMNHAYLRANGNRHLIGFEEGEMVLSRFPLVFAEFSELQPRAGFFEHRVVLHTVAQTPLGLIDLYATHLTNGAQQINRGQVASLQDYVTRTARHTALVAGDFNATEKSPQINELSRLWVDAYRVANPSLPGFTCCIEDLSAPQNPPLTKRIDYIFLVLETGEQFSISGAQVVFNEPQRHPEGWLWASDHAGVLVTIEPVK